MKEREARKELEGRGYKVIKNGWPDFLVIDKYKETAFAVEVKHRSSLLEKHQKEMHRYLIRLGIPVVTARKNVNFDVKGKKMRPAAEFEKQDNESFCRSCKKKKDCITLCNKLRERLAYPEDMRERLLSPDYIDRVFASKNPVNPFYTDYDDTPLYDYYDKRSKAVKELVETFKSFGERGVLYLWVFFASNIMQMSQADIGRMLGVSQESISRILLKIKADTKKKCLKR